MVELGKTNKHRGQSLLQTHLRELIFGLFSEYVANCILSKKAKYYVDKHPEMFLKQSLGWLHLYIQ